MSKTSKAQVEPLTAVMVTTLIIASVSTVYVWGTPLLDKREAESELTGLENQMIELQNAIHEVESAGDGATERITMELPEDSEINVEESIETIRVEIRTDEMIYSEDSVFTLTGSNVTETGFYEGGEIKYGIEGIHHPSSLQVETVSASDEHLVNYRIELNPLFTSSEFGEVLLYRDISVPETASDRGVDEIDVVITNAGDNIEEEAADNIQGGLADVQIQKIEIDIEA